MRVVGIKQLKNKLSEYVKLAASGETILVTDRDRVVAELSPPSDGRSPAVADARYADLVRRGIITPARVKSTAPPPRLPTMSLDELLAELDADREDR